MGNIICLFASFEIILFVKKYKFDYPPSPSLTMVCILRYRSYKTQLYQLQVREKRHGKNNDRNWKLSSTQYCSTDRTTSAEYGLSTIQKRMKVLLRFHNISSVLCIMRFRLFHKVLSHTLFCVILRYTKCLYFYFWAIILTH